MSEKKFTQEEIEELQKNPYVRKASEKSITYTDEFKEYFRLEYEAGKKPVEIFRTAGFDTGVLGRSRIKSFRHGNKIKAARPEGTRDLRAERNGRPKTKGLTPKEQIQRLKQKVKYLEQENMFLKKIESAGRKAERKQALKKNTKSSKK